MLKGVHRIGLLLFICPLIPQVTYSQTPEERHRFEYSAEHFSIELPVAWKEVDAATVAIFGPAAALAIPNAPKIKINHGYTSSDLSSHAVLIRLTYERLPDAAFQNWDDTGRTVNQTVKGWLTGGAIQSAQVENMSYDKDRHLVWITSKMSSVLSGEVRVVTGLYLTAVGTIQVICSSKAADFEKSEPECRQIIRSVLIDPTVTITAAPSLSTLLSLGTEEANSRYRDLVARVKGKDFTVDFRTLRMACAKSTVCAPRATPADLVQMSEAATEHRWSDAAEIAERLLVQGFINMEAHNSAMQAYTELHQPEQAKFHLDVITALLRSILDAGDGKSAATAYEIISVREEYILLNARGLRSSGGKSSPLNEGGHHYLRWAGRDPKSQADVVVFFNMDGVTRE